VRTSKSFNIEKQRERERERERERKRAHGRFKRHRSERSPATKWVALPRAGIRGGIEPRSLPITQFRRDFPPVNVASLTRRMIASKFCFFSSSLILDAAPSPSYGPMITR
jgi:hypothetical protein